MDKTPLNGLIILDKPSGAPSNRVLGRLKHLLGMRGKRGGKAGFLGTLDPLATGVLPVFVGKATKLIPIFEGLDKTYRATLMLGRTTDTLDAEGKVTGEADIAGIEATAVREAVLSFEGEMEQLVPAFSAVKIDGRPSYRLARGGEAVAKRIRTVRLAGLEVESVALPHATFRVTCSAGTYVRGLVRDIGESLGVGAHLTALRRLDCGGLFTLENSSTLEQIERRASLGDFGFVFNPADYLPQFRPFSMDEAMELYLRDGRTVPLPEVTGDPPPGARAMALRPCGTLVAIGKVVKFRCGGWGFQPDRVVV
ncbi:MAG: tRNA pseudouridine(55) synthase TruB [bacterium]